MADSSVFELSVCNRQGSISTIQPEFRNSATQKKAHNQEPCILQFDAISASLSWKQPGAFNESSYM